MDPSGNAYVIKLTKSANLRQTKIYLQCKWGSWVGGQEDPSKINIPLFDTLHGGGGGRRDREKRPGIWGGFESYRTTTST